MAEIINLTIILYLKDLMALDLLLSLLSAGCLGGKVCKQMSSSEQKYKQTHAFAMNH